MRVPFPEVSGSDHPHDGDRVLVNMERAVAARLYDLHLDHGAFLRQVQLACEAIGSDGPFATDKAGEQDRTAAIAALVGRAVEGVIEREAVRMENIATAIHMASNTGQNAPPGDDRLRATGPADPFDPSDPRAPFVPETDAKKGAAA